MYTVKTSADAVSEATAAALTRVETQLSLVDAKMKKIDELAVTVASLETKVAKAVSATAASSQKTEGQVAHLAAEVERVGKDVAYLKADMLQYVPAVRVQAKTQQ